MRNEDGEDDVGSRIYLVDFIFKFIKKKAVSLYRSKRVRAYDY